jgi:16S rRNA (guanine(966)-N(2))-methyltransferase RsmD
MRLAAPRGTDTRPTADRVREALFSILQAKSDIEGSRILDICAGTGALGLEALSRGAGLCCFVENERNALIALIKNIATIGCKESVKVMEMDAVRALKLLSNQDKLFDIIFFDPPYQSNLYSLVTEAISDFHLLAENGILVAESSVRYPLAEKIGNLIKSDRRIYGDTALEFYNWEKQ